MDARLGMRSHTIFMVASSGTDSKAPEICFVPTWCTSSLGTDFN